MSATLIIAPSWVGDAVLSQPLLAALKAQAPDTPIDVFAPPWCGAVYRRMPQVRAVIENPFGHGALRLRERRKLGCGLRGRYSQAFVLPGSFKSALVPWFAGIPKRAGAKGEFRFGVLTHALAMTKASIPLQVDRYLALAEALDIKLPHDPKTPGHPTGLPPHPLREGWGEGSSSKSSAHPKSAAQSPEPRLTRDPTSEASTFAKLNFDPTQNNFALCPGAEFGPSKRWPAEHFGALALNAIERGAQVWLIGSAKDDEVARQIVSELGRGGGSLARVHNLCGKTTLPEALDLLANMSAVVSNDSGLMHIAAAYDRSLVALFGSTSPANTPPLSKRATVLQHALPCQPCFKRECPLGHHACMQELKPERVIQLVAAI